MRVLAVDIAKQTGWVVATEDGSIIETGTFDEQEEASEPAAQLEGEVVE